MSLPGRSKGPQPMGPSAQRPSAQRPGPNGPGAQGPKAQWPRSLGAQWHKSCFCLLFVTRGPWALCLYARKRAGSLRMFTELNIGGSRWDRSLLHSTKIQIKNKKNINTNQKKVHIHSTRTSSQYSGIKSCLYSANDMAVPYQRRWTSCCRRVHTDIAWAAKLCLVGGFLC